MARPFCSAWAVLFCMGAHADLLASSDPALASVLMDSDGSVACKPGGSACGPAEPSLSLLQNHALGVAAKDGAAGAASARLTLADPAKAEEAPKQQKGQATYIDVALRSQDTREVAIAVAASAASAASATSAASPGKENVAAEAAAIWIFVLLGLLLLAALLAVHMVDGDEPGFPKYIAEFVGTFMLVFSVGCNVLVGDATWGVVAIACTLMVSIYALGGVSGGNFNPSVSVALGLSGKMPWGQVGVYVCTQLAAGIAASLAYGLMLSSTFNLGPSGGFSFWQAGLAELLYTAMLCFVVLNTAASKKHAGVDQFYGLAIGFSVVAGGYGGGSISGGCFNPAVALGIDASSTGLGFGWFFPYMFFEILGAGLAAFLFRHCRPGDFDESLADEEPAMGASLLSEFLGTYMLVLTVGLNVLAGSQAAVFSIAASLMCMIFALGSVSGAHFNPAVTMAILCSQRGLISVGKAAAYMGAQVSGGILAAITYSTMQNGKTVSLKPSASSTEVEALIGEFVFTFLLSFVVLSVATVKSPLSQYFGLAIGSCVTAGGLAIGSLSGGSLNPAVSTGLALTDAVANSGPLSHLPAYVVVELLAGAAAAGVFRATHVAEYCEKA